MTDYALIRAQKWLRDQYPVEEHNVGGDCMNPKCDYEFTEQDLDEMALNSGWFTCPNCDWTYNYMDPDVVPRTRAGLTPTQMGDIGEKIVERMGTIPGLGDVGWVSNDPSYPIDMIVDDFGVEIKTVHSESQPRFKMGGGGGQGGKRQGTREEKLRYVEQNGLRPALIGVRLNFYTDTADVFVRPDSFTDTWIGAPQLIYVDSVNFSDLNPFKRPEDVPPRNELPDDDSDIPF